MILGRSPPSFSLNDTFLSCPPIHPLSDRLELSAGMLAGLAERNREAFKNVQRRRGQVAMTHNSLPQPVETMLQMRILVTRAHDGLRNVVMVLRSVADVIAIHFSIELHAHGVDAV